jgi:hypothetical protein
MNEKPFTYLYLVYFDPQGEIYEIKNKHQAAAD